MIPLTLLHRLDADESGYSPVGSLDGLYSMVWTQRWQDYGEAQITAPPDCPAKTGDLVTVLGRDMAAEIVGRTETEKAVELRCRDALAVLDRRVTYPAVKNDGSVSTFITKMLQTDGIVGDGTQTGDRALKPVRIGDLTAITASARVQRSYRPMGQTMLELGRAYGFDPVASLTGKHIVIGARAEGQTVRTWMRGGHLASFEEDEDIAQWKNVAYVAAQEFNGQRVTQEVSDGFPAGMARRELAVDRRDLMAAGSPADMEGAYGPITFDDAQTAPEDAWIQFEEDGTFFTDASFEAECYYGGRSATIKIDSLLTDGWQLFNALVTELEDRWDEFIGVTLKSDPDNKQWLTDFSYNQGGGLPPLHRQVETPFGWVMPYATASVYGELESAGREALADLQPETAFGATVEGLVPYQDYNLGDRVKIIKRIGEVREMRVTEIIESWDGQGYRASPTLASL